MALITLRQLLDERLHLRGPNLQAQAARIGRKLPGRVRRDIALVARAEVQSQSPRLAMQTDTRAVERAARNAARHLRGIDPAFVRNTRILRALAKVAFVVLAVFIVTVWVLATTGRI